MLNRNQYQQTNFVCSIWRHQPTFLEDSVTVFVEVLLVELVQIELLQIDQLIFGFWSGELLEQMFRQFDAHDSRLVWDQSGWQNSFLEICFKKQHRTSQSGASFGEVCVSNWDSHCESLTQSKVETSHLLITQWNWDFLRSLPSHNYDCNQTKVSLESIGCIEENHTGRHENFSQKLSKLFWTKKQQFLWMKKFSSDEQEKERLKVWNWSSEKKVYDQNFFRPKSFLVKTETATSPTFERIPFERKFQKSKISRNWCTHFVCLGIPTWDLKFRAYLRMSIILTPFFEAVLWFAF